MQFTFILLASMNCAIPTLNSSQPNQVETSSIDMPVIINPEPTSEMDGDSLIVAQESPLISTDGVDENNVQEKSADEVEFERDNSSSQLDVYTEDGKIIKEEVDEYSPEIF